MKSKIILATIFAFLLIGTLQTVSAYHNTYYGNSDGTRVVYGFDGEFFTQDYQYVDDYYGRPVYRIYGSRENCHNCDWRYHDDDGVSKRRVVRFLEKSFNKRYAVTAGESSKEAFCEDCQTDGSKTSFGNKKAYNLLANNDNYYYKPKFNSNTQTFNWRF